MISGYVLVKTIRKQCASLIFVKIRKQFLDNCSMTFVFVHVSLFL